MVQKDVVKLARKQVATVAAVSVPEGVTLEKMGKVRLETRATPQTPQRALAGHAIVARRTASPSRTWPARRG